MAIAMTMTTLLLLGLSAANTLMHVGKDVGARLHTAAQFVTAKDLGQPRCPSMGN